MQAGIYIIEFELAQVSTFHGPYLFTKKKEVLEEVAELRAGLGYSSHRVILHEVHSSRLLHELQ